MGHQEQIPKQTQCFPMNDDLAKTVNILCTKIHGCMSKCDYEFGVGMNFAHQGSLTYMNLIIVPLPPTMAMLESITFML